MLHKPKLLPKNIMNPSLNPPVTHHHAHKQINIDATQTKITSKSLMVPLHDPPVTQRHTHKLTKT